MSRDLSKSQIRRLWKKKHSCDVTLIAGIDGETFSAHTAVLSGAADFFRGLFACHFEAKQKDEFKIENVTGDVLEKVIECCYKRGIAINGDNIESLLEAASFFLFPLLAKKCEKYLSKRGNINTENCVGLWSLANRCSFWGIRAATSQFLLENFLKITKSDDFYQLDKAELKEILENDDIAVNSEEDVFNALVGWVKFNPKERRGEFPDLNQAVRLDRLEDSFLLKEVRAVCREFKCEETFTQLRELKLSPGEQNIRSRQRRPTSSGLIAIIYKNGNQFLIMKYSPVVDEWTILRELSLGNEHCFSIASARTVTVVDTKLFICTEYPPTKMSHSIDLNTFEIKELKLMPNLRCDFSIVGDGGFMYAAGGRKASYDSNSDYKLKYRTADDDYDPESFLRYDIKSDGWTILSPLLVSRDKPAIVNFSGTIYVLGGRGGQCSELCLNSVEKYDSLKGAWTSVAPLIKKIKIAAAGVASGFLYVCNHDDCKDTSKYLKWYSWIQRYDPQAKEWTLMQIQLRSSGSFASMWRNWVFIGIDKSYENYTFAKQNLITGEVIELSSFGLNLTLRGDINHSLLYVGPSWQVDVVRCKHLNILAFLKHAIFPPHKYKIYSLILHFVQILNLVLILYFHTKFLFVYFGVNLYNWVFLAGVVYFVERYLRTSMDTDFCHTYFWHTTGIIMRVLIVALIPLHAIHALI